MSTDPNDIPYDAMNFDGLERRANYRTIAYREDVLHALDKKDSAAIVYHIIYRWQTEVKRDEVLAEINRRKKAGLPPLTPEEVENRMWVYMSYNDFMRESGHALGYNTVIRVLDYLINEKKVVEQRPNHDPHYPDYEYRINKGVVKTLLKALPMQPAFTPKIPKKSTHTGTSTHLGIVANQSTQMGTASTQKGIATTQMGTEVYPNGGTSQNYSQNYNTENTQEERVASQNFDATAPALSETENDNHSYRHDHTRKEDDWACNNWRGAHKGKTCTDYQAYIDSGAREETPTEPRTPAIQIGVTDGQHTASASGNSVDAGSGNDHLELHKGQVADGHPTPDHPTADHRAADSVRADEASEQIAIASTPDGAVAPPTAAVRQSHTTPAREASSVPTEAHEGHGRNDGATTVTASEPRPSGKQLPLSLKEDEPTVRPETPAQRKRRIEQREKEIWALVEEKLSTKFSRTQRQSAANAAGMENLIEDETDDETIKTALDRLTDFWRAQFNLKQFHTLIPGLLAAKAPTPTTNGKPANSDAPVKRWSMAEHKRMLKELEASQHNLQA